MLGDSIGAGIVYHLSRDELDSMGKAPSKLETGFESVPLAELEERDK